MRWLSFFDLLGTKNLIDSKHWGDVFEIYARSIEKFRIDHQSNSSSIKRICFSDSFIVYSEGASAQEFSQIDQFSRIFMGEMISSRIVLRGALAFGEFYADEIQSVFFGKALNEAYKYGEAQNWIGFVLCPSAVSKIHQHGLTNSLLLNYQNTSIPTKNDALTTPFQLPAYVIGGRSNGSLSRLVVNALESLRDESADAYEKYQNTLNFISANQVHG